MSAKSMKGPWGLEKLTVVDNVPCMRRTRPWLALCEHTRKDLKRLLADAYWPLLTQATSKLGISIENVKIYFDPFPAFEFVCNLPSIIDCYENWHNQ